MNAATVRPYRSILDIPLTPDRLIITKIANSQWSNRNYFVAKYYRASGIEPVFTVRGRTAAQAERYARQQMGVYNNDEIAGYPVVEVN